MKTNEEYKSVVRDMKKLRNTKQARLLARFFKTGKGQYGQGDIFWGIMVPETRSIAKNYRYLLLQDIRKLLSSQVHEIRLCALLILVDQYEKGDKSQKEKIFEFYLGNTHRINNWDLVDLSAHKIVGAHLKSRSHALLLKLARSRSLWERRIAIISTFYFIKEFDFETSLQVAELLKGDKHDLIQKAVGWMLREIGNRDLAVEERFLKKFYKKLPRTLLRYAIEKFPERIRQAYLKGSK